MYDPLVVDTFIEAYPAISSTAGAILAERGISNHAKLETINASAPAERGRLGSDGSDRVAESLVTMLEQRLPNVAIAFFSYDIAANLLVCSYATSNLPEQVRRVVIRPGDRVTGWVAANIRTAVNCDPALDIGEASLGQLGRMVSVPILDTKHAELRGVVSVYSFDGADFTPEHVRLIESAALLASRRPQPRRVTALIRPHATTHLAS